MEEIEELRKKIDVIDEKMKDLFLKRLEVINKIKEYKIANRLPILDSAREQYIIHQIIKDETIPSLEKAYYIKFIQYLMDLSKDYQK